MTRYELFDRRQLQLRDLSERGHDIHPDQCAPLHASLATYRHPEFPELVQALQRARQQDRPVVLMMGAHPIKLGLSRYRVDLNQRGLVTLLATNGAGLIHDFELALGGGTSEDVARWIRQGQFGLWRETSQINDILRTAATRKQGFGEALGQYIEEQGFPRADLSIAAAGWRCGVPVTSHVSIGHDIIHAHANCDPAALGQVSYTDFLIFARQIQDLEGGVFLNVGSAVTGPEVYLKALSMARNVARQKRTKLSRFTTAVFDLVSLPASFREGTPAKTHPLYYYRPWKTILVRTVADGGHSYYFCGDHRQTIPTLWHQAVTNGSGRRPAGAAA